MYKLINTLNGGLKLINGLAVLAAVIGIVLGGLWVYHKVAVFTATPIQVPSVKIPHLAMPKLGSGTPKIKRPNSGIFAGLRFLGRRFRRTNGNAAHGQDRPPLTSAEQVETPPEDSQVEDTDSEATAP